MKKADIIARLTTMRELTKAVEVHAAIDQLVADLGPATETSEGKLHYYVEVKQQIIDPAVKYPKQMLTCYTIIKDKFGLDKPVERKQIIDAINERSDELNTRQSPERIYAFYQKRMEEEGWVERAKERVTA